MSNRRVALLFILSLVVGAYGGWIYCRSTNPWSDSFITIYGQSQVAMVPPPNEEVAKPARITPTDIVAMCKISEFQIDRLTDNGELAKILMRHLTPVQLDCLVRRAPNNLSVESSGANAQMH